MNKLILTIALMTAVMETAAQPIATLDKHHLLLDGSLTHDEAQAQPFVFNDFREAVAHLSDTTTLYICPWVYWVDNPDVPEMVKGENGREPFGIVIRAKKLNFIGLAERPEDVVLAAQRGQTQGAIGNFTMFDMYVDELRVENMTLGNYCNVDLDYPRRPELSRKKRNNAITQAHVGYVHGRSLHAKKVRFISRLNLNPLNGARESVYDSCHFECTDDALNGTATYRHCDFDLYGQKPFWSTFGAGAMFIDCDFNVKSDNREIYFCKQGGPVTVVNCRYHAPSDSLYLGWTAYPQPWLRCYQTDFTLNGKPYVIGMRKPQNTIVLHHADSLISRGIPYLNLSQHEAELRTGEAPLTLACSDSESVKWRVTDYREQYVTLVPIGRDSLKVIPTNHSGKTVDFCVMANTPDGREAACHLTVHPCLLPAPAFLHGPTIQLKKDVAQLNYDLDLQDRDDESEIIWLRDDIPVSVVKVHPWSWTYPEYRLSDADNGHRLSALIIPKLHCSLTGDTIHVDVPKVIKGQKKRELLETDFHDLPCQWQSRVLSGYWTIDGFKPIDTAEYPWTFDPKKPMWEYGEGFNGAVGKGLLQAQRGARLMYTPIEGDYDNMSLTLQVDPTKTAGQGFGSATGQYMDICLKFDTQTLTGYGLRIIRTVKHAKAVDFYLVAYNNGVVTPLTDPISSTCYRTGCTISLNYAKGLLTAHVETKTPKPADSTLPHQVDLQARVDANSFGGIHIQHTGSCGESTTMLHHLKATW
jgi:hypothetical protein